MFSYRHAFHAGNHADVLKHTVLIATLQHLTQKETPLAVVDTHAGAGLYRLDGDYASTSGESTEGVQRLLDTPEDKLTPALKDYLSVLRGFNQGNKLRVYPGSPFISNTLLRPQDRMHLFELHPTDSRTLAGNIAQLDPGKRIMIAQEDGFGSLKKLLPPPSRRALVLCDPSYEIKTDYVRVGEMIEEALVRFPTGTYAVWYPIIARHDAHDLPRRLKTLATKAGKSWLHATLTVKSSKMQSASLAATNDEQVKRPGLPASGMFLINPPFTLKEKLKQSLPQMVELLGQDKNAAFTLESGS